MRSLAIAAVVLCLLQLVGGQGPGIWSNYDSREANLDLWWPRVASTQNRFCLVWQANINTPADVNNPLVAVTSQEPPTSLFDSWPQLLSRPPKYQTGYSNFVSWYSQYGIAASNAGCFIFGRSSEALHLHFLNATSPDAQIWGQWPPDQQSAGARHPNLIWSMDLIPTVPFDSWSSATGARHVLFVASTHTSIKGLTIDTQNMTNILGPFDIYRDAAKVFSPAAGYCSNVFYTAYFEASTTYPTTSWLGIMSASEANLTAWTKISVIETEYHSDNASISDILCFNSTHLLMAVRFGASRRVTPNLRSSIRIYLFNTILGQFSDVVIADHLLIDSDLWAGLSIARIADWLIVKFSAQTSSTYQWKSYVSFAHATNPLLWTRASVLDAPEPRYNQSSIQHSLACTGTICMSPYTRQFGLSGVDSDLVTKAVWQSWTLAGCTAPPPSNSCFSGIGCNLSNCTCGTNFEPSITSPGTCQSLCGNGQLDPSEQCESGVGCDLYTCRCNSTAGYFPSGAGQCVEACVPTIYYEPCPISHPYRCGGCCAIAPCEIIPRRCPQAQCPNGSCVPYSMAQDACSASCPPNVGEICPNGMCVASLDQCEPIPTCSALEARCTNGSCAKCAQELPCSGRTKRCMDGVCRLNCDGLRFFGCAPGSVMCPTGVCVNSTTLCPNESPGGYYLCHNGKTETAQMCDTPLLLVSSKVSNVSRWHIDGSTPSFTLKLVPATLPNLPALFEATVTLSTESGPGEFFVTQIPSSDTVGRLGDQNTVMSAAVKVSWSTYVKPYSIQLVFALDTLQLNDRALCLWSLDAQQCLASKPVLGPEQGNYGHVNVSIITPGTYAIRLIPPRSPSTGVSEPIGVVGAVAIIILAVAVVILIAILMYISMRFRDHRRKTAKLTMIADRSTRSSRNVDNAWNLYTALPAFSEKFLAKDFPTRAIEFKQLTIGREIGKGAYSRVREGFYHGTKVAIKIADRGTDAPDVVSCLRREAAILFNLRPHNNIIQASGIAENQSLCYLVLEYCARGSVQQYYGKKRQPTLQEQYQIIRGVASALEHLHKFGVVHRDVAARNILLTEDGSVRLADFGLSRKLGKGEKFGVFKSKHGPVRWMAPECFLHRHYSFATDVWAFANAVCEILSGEEPYHGQDYGAVAEAIRDHSSHPRVPNTCPHWLKKLLLQCWAPDPQDRPSMQKICKKLADHMLPGAPSRKRRDIESSEEASEALTGIRYDADELPPLRSVAIIPQTQQPPEISNPLPVNNVLDPPQAVLVDTYVHEDALEDD